MDIIGWIAVAFGVGYGIYEIARCKYEAFGLVVSGKGGRAIEIKKFHTEKKALEYYHECQKKYGLACLREI